MYSCVSLSRLTGVSDRRYLTDDRLFARLEGFVGGIIARFVPEITLSRVRLWRLGCADPHITCPTNVADRSETVRSMETKREVRTPETG